MQKKLLPKPVQQQTPSPDSIDRRGFLECMAWVGTGVLWTMSGGILSSCTLGPTAKTPAIATPTSPAKIPDFSFVQISDSHIGFNKAPNQNVTATLQETIARVNALPSAPAFLLHTGDLTHLATPEQFDTVSQILTSAKPRDTFYVPGEHDVFTDSAKTYLERFGKNTRGNGWYSFDYKSVHLVALVNVMDLKAGGLGQLGPDQLAWLKNDLAACTNSTPIVLFAHVPLWTVYAEWGWGTEDSEQALALLRRFGSVTVLNGHIHQILQKIEGNITFHTARSTAFPQPAPGAAPSPGPLKNVPPEKLRSLLGLTSIRTTQINSPLAIIDSTLG